MAAVWRTWRPGNLAGQYLFLTSEGYSCYANNVIYNRVPPRTKNTLGKCVPWSSKGTCTTIFMVSQAPHCQPHENVILTACIRYVNKRSCSASHGQRGIRQFQQVLKMFLPKWIESSPKLHRRKQSFSQKPSAFHVHIVFCDQSMPFRLRNDAATLP